MLYFISFYQSFVQSFLSNRRSSKVIRRHHLSHFVCLVYAVSVNPTVIQFNVIINFHTFQVRIIKVRDKAYLFLFVFWQAQVDVISVVKVIAQILLQQRSYLKYYQNIIHSKVFEYNSFKRRNLYTQKKFYFLPLQFQNGFF